MSGMPQKKKTQMSWDASEWDVFDQNTIVQDANNLSPKHMYSEAMDLCSMVQLQFTVAQEGGYTSVTSMLMERQHHEQQKWGGGAVCQKQMVAQRPRWEKMVIMKEKHITPLFALLIL